MNILIISFLAIASLSTFPTKTFGSTDLTQKEEPTIGVVPAAAVAAVAAVAPAQSALPAGVPAVPQLHNGVEEIWQEDDREVLIRNERGAKNNNNNNSGGATPNADSCRYVKGPWTECDAKTNTRSRSLTLKKGDATTCVQTRTIQKKCKKACRYEKGTWSECGTTGQMSRTDKLKNTSDTTCQQTRIVNKNCNQGKQNKDKQHKETRQPKNGNKEKGARKNRQ